MQLRRGAQSFMEDGFHLGRGRVGLATLTHSREMKLYPVCERPPGLKFSRQPNNQQAVFLSGPTRYGCLLQAKLPAWLQEMDNSCSPAPGPSPLVAKKTGGQGAPMLLS